MVFCVLFFSVWWLVFFSGKGTARLSRVNDWFVFCGHQRRRASGQFYWRVGIFRSLSDIFHYHILTNTQKGFMRKCPLYMRPKRSRPNKKTMKSKTSAIVENYFVWWPRPTASDFYIYIYCIWLGGVVVLLRDKTKQGGDVSKHDYTKNLPL